MKPARAREPHLRSSRRAQPPREKVAAPSCDLQAELATFPRTDPRRSNTGRLTGWTLRHGCPARKGRREPVPFRKVAERVVSSKI